MILNISVETINGLSEVIRLPDRTYDILNTFLNIVLYADVVIEDLNVTREVLNNSITEERRNLLNSIRWGCLLRRGGIILVTKVSYILWTIPNGPCIDAYN
jgi:hypothetical protein